MWSAISDENTESNGWVEMSSRNLAEHCDTKEVHQPNCYWLETWTKMNACIQTDNNKCCSYQLVQTHPTFIFISTVYVHSCFLLNDHKVLYDRVTNLLPKVCTFSLITFNFRVNKATLCTKLGSEVLFNLADEVLSVHIWHICLVLTLNKKCQVSCHLTFHYCFNSHFLKCFGKVDQIFVLVKFCSGIQSLGPSKNGWNWICGSFLE